MVADDNGFFKINVASGEVNLDFTKDAYYEKSFEELTLTDY